MCGIAGIVNLDGSPVDIGILYNMGKSIRHRGPDDEGYLLINAKNNSFLELIGNDTVPERKDAAIDILNFNTRLHCLGFAHRRLSIIDLSSAGHQPMANDDESLWIVYNGEVYNYKELRIELMAKGCKFNTNTDTEVVLKAYEVWGKRCLKKFNGMWGFCICDLENKKLFCARDRFGIKPFYFYYNHKIFVFGSEIKAILCHPQVPRMVNQATVFDYLVFNNMDCGEDTFFEEIKSLKPSHYLTVDLNTGSIKISKWYDLNTMSEVGDYIWREGNQLALRFRELFEDAVRLRMRSDVPIGTCLSGGLDSSSVVCMVNRLIFEDGVIGKELVGERQKTFTACFECFTGTPRDERKWVDIVIQKTNTEKNYVFPDGDDGLWIELPKVIWHMDEPFGSASVYSQYCVMRKASQRGVTVVLDGQGGDEFLAGYGMPYFPTFIANTFLSKDIVSAIKEAKAISLVRNIDFRSLLISSFGHSLPPFIQYLTRRFFRTIRGNSVLAMLNPSFRNRFNERYTGHLRDLSYGSSSLKKKLLNYIFIYTLPNLLHHEDRNSMAFSLEARFPFLDFRLDEFLLSLPTSQLISQGWNKLILRQGLKGVLPDEIRLRKDKEGYATPEGAWLLRGRKKVHQILNDKDLLSRGFINAEMLLRNLDNPSIAESIQTGLPWRVLDLEIWLQVFWGKLKDKV